MTDHECRERAEIALKVAEANLETVTRLFNDPANARGITFTDLIANAEARVNLAHGWLELWEVS